MSNVIAVLESIGRNGALRYATASEVNKMLNDNGVPSEISSALVVGDHDLLCKLLDAEQNVCCAVHAPEEFDNEEAGAN